MAHDSEITRDHFEQPSWDERYAGDGRTWSGRPNAVLVAEAGGLAPGRAVDLGCGEGGDSIWLAGRGWQVTGIDFSSAGLAPAAAHASEAGVEGIDWRQADLRTWTPGGEQWDLVTSHFLHLLDAGMLEATRRMAEAVAPGGTLLVVGHHPEDAHTGLRWSMPGVLFTAEDLAPALDRDRFDVRVEARRRTEAHDSQEHAATDAVLVAVRK
jgi:SAM-dependent methyltransferase